MTKGRQRRILRERWTNTDAWRSYLEHAAAAARMKPVRSKQQRLALSARLKHVTPSQRWGSTTCGFSRAEIRHRKMCCCRWPTGTTANRSNNRSEEHTSELQ